MESSFSLPFGNRSCRGSTGLTYNEVLTLRPNCPFDYDEIVFKHISKIDTKLLMLECNKPPLEEFSIDILSLDPEIEIVEEKPRGSGFLSFLGSPKATSNKPRRKKRDIAVEDLFEETWQSLKSRGFDGMLIVGLLDADSMPKNDSRKRYNLNQLVNYTIHSIEAFYMFHKVNLRFIPNLMNMNQIKTENDLDSDRGYAVILAWKLAKAGYTNGNQSRSLCDMATNIKEPSPKYESPAIKNIKNILEQGRGAASVSLKEALSKRMFERLPSATSQSREGTTENDESEIMDEDDEIAEEDDEIMEEEEEDKIDSKGDTVVETVEMRSPTKIKTITTTHRDSPRVVRTVRTTETKVITTKQTRGSKREREELSEEEEVMDDEVIVKKRPTKVPKVVPQDPKTDEEEETTEVPSESVTQETTSSETQDVKKPGRKSMGRKSIAPDWPEEEKEVILQFYDSLNPETSEQTRIALTCKYASMQYDLDLAAKYLYQWRDKKNRSVHQRDEDLTFDESRKKEIVTKFFTTLNDTHSLTSRINFVTKYLKVQYDVSITSKMIKTWLGKK